MTETNGWPGKPGVPRDPHQSGWHWLSGATERPAAFEWLAHKQAWLFHRAQPEAQAMPPPAFGSWTYLGPVLTPDEAAKREDAKWHEGYAVGVLDVRRAGIERRTKHKAMQKRVAELEGALDAAGRVLHKAGEQFSEYATQFAAHKTAVSDLKAAANKQWAERCFSAYWRAVEGGKDE